ncbi:GNAT family N-acetyltransferase [Longitalea arenae]|uniref:GNAT family N-acetyltransferase n=1 Tax=Longitalea arenae TaxID=2812558 RepID=UPI0019679D6F|nr:GNAT family N-acetyltransferase [Longitalea arenae]
MDLKEKNIQNIISLWNEVSKPFNGNYQKEHYHYCYIPFSAWPNRLWSYEYTPAVVDEAIQEIRNGKEKLAVSYWGDDFDMFTSKGFEQRTQQVGMSLPLQKKFVFESRLQLVPVTTMEQSIQWSHTFQAAFNYFIHEDLIFNAPKPVQFFVAMLENEVIGTALLYIDNGIAGVHSVGVVPTMRKKGFAEEIMKALINRSIEGNASWCMLQASKMGIGIYARLGFQEDFLFTQYRLPG